jgi:hypothetical protein
MQNTEKPKRVLLAARVAPEDRERIESRAARECRSVGEVLALLIRENELLSEHLRRERELITNALGG